MKIYKTLLLGMVFMLFTISACEDILEEEPLNFLDPAGAFDNERNAQLTVDGIYSVLFSSGLYSNNMSRILWEMEYYYGTPVMDHENPPNLPPPSNSTTPWIYGAWSGSYQLINICNIIIDGVSNMPEGSISEEARRQFLGEAHFFRAFTYFYAVRLWGDLPMQTDPTADPSAALLPRSPAQEVYEQIIIPDLEIAKANLPISYTGTYPDLGRPTRGAAIAYLGQAYLTMAQRPLSLGDSHFQLAKTELEQLVDPSSPHLAKSPFTYALEEDFQNNIVYTENFIVTKPENELGKEEIFGIHARPDLGMGQFYLNNANRPMWQYMIDFYDENIDPLFSFNDFRFISTWEPNPDNRVQPGALRIRKFQRDNQGSVQRSRDQHLMQYADVLLMLAEIENELNDGPNDQAVGYINALRARARGEFLAPPETLGVTLSDGSNETEWNATNPAPVPVDLVAANLTYDQFDFVLHKEVIIESIAEGGKLWFHWVRSGRVEEWFNATNLIYKPGYELLAIPAQEIQVSGGVLAQNPGW